MTDFADLEKLLEAEVAACTVPNNKDHERIARMQCKVYREFMHQDVSEFDALMEGGGDVHEFVYKRIPNPPYVPRVRPDHSVQHYMRRRYEELCRKRASLADACTRRSDTQRRREHEHSDKNSVNEFLEDAIRCSTEAKALCEKAQDCLAKMYNQPLGEMRKSLKNIVKFSEGADVQAKCSQEAADKLQRIVNESSPSAEKKGDSQKSASNVTRIEDSYFEMLRDRSLVNGGRKRRPRGTGSR